MIKMDFPNECNVRGCLILKHLSVIWNGGFVHYNLASQLPNNTQISYLIQVSYYIVFFFHCTGKVMCFVSQKLDVDKISSKCRFTFTKSLQFWPSQTTNKMLMCQVRHFSLNGFPFNFVTLKVFPLSFNWNRQNSPKLSRATVLNYSHFFPVSHGTKSQPFNFFNSKFIFLLSYNPHFTDIIPLN